MRILNKTGLISSVIGFSSIALIISSLAGCGSMGGGHRAHHHHHHHHKVVVEKKAGKPVVRHHEDTKVLVKDKAVKVDTAK